MSLFVISEILGLGLFLNTLTADHEYSLCNRENLSRSIQRQFSQKSKVFLNFFLHFWNLHQILNFFLEKMTLIVHLFPKLWTAKDLVRKISKKPCFGTSFERQYAKRSQKLLKSARQYFYLFSIIIREMELENFPLSNIWNLRTACQHIDYYSPMTSILFMIART